MKKFKLVLKSFQVFKARYLHFKAYFHIMRNQPYKAQHLLSKALLESNRSGCLYDSEWCLHSKNTWFPNDNTSDQIQQEEDNEDTIFMYQFQK